MGNESICRQPWSCASPISLLSSPLGPTHLTVVSCCHCFCTWKWWRVGRGPGGHSLQDGLPSRPQISRTNMHGVCGRLLAAAGGTAVDLIGPLRALGRGLPGRSLWRKSSWTTTQGLSGFRIAMFRPPQSCCASGWRGTAPPLLANDSFALLLQLTCTSYASMEINNLLDEQWQFLWSEAHACFVRSGSEHMQHQRFYTCREGDV